MGVGLIVAIILGILAIVIAIFLIIMFHKKSQDIKPPRPNQPIIINFAGHLTNGYANMSIEEIRTGAKERLKIIAHPKDIEYGDDGNPVREVKMQDTIVPKVFMDIFPKGTLSTNRSFIFIYPRHADEISIKDSRLGKALVKVVTEAQTEDFVSKTTRESMKEKETMMKDRFTDKEARETVRKVRDSWKDIMEIFKRGREPESKHT